ncbi:MAG: aminopeptidase P family protein [Planctomycetales bacterium]|nr:aminopeptidase P family protein [Planctomycetales bacterium]
MYSDPYAVDIQACRGRQQRLLIQMEELGLELVLLTRSESVQWLTGTYSKPNFTPAAAIDMLGHVTLVVPKRNESLVVAADEIVGYEAQWHSTIRDEQRATSNEALLGALDKRPQRVGGEWSFLGPRLVAEFGGEVVNVEPMLARLRRRKDADELRMLARANAANRAMYVRAREIIEPGINELEVFNELHAAAVRELGEPLTYFGQDFQCNSRGGAPRDRAAQAGELYILDLGVGFRGFYSDNARTISVGGEPDELQERAWNHLVQALQLVESAVRPGKSCRQMFEEVQALLDGCGPGVFNHHLGHGVGLAPHEGPHLNPYWDDVFEPGDYFTAEPGLYHDRLRQGIRLEENYVVTAEGVERVTDFPLGLGRE